MFQQKQTVHTGVWSLSIGVAITMFLLLGFISVSSAEIDAAPYLRMGAGARALGMGGAFTAVADDATATVLNPAGLSNVKEDYSVTLFTSKMSYDRKHSFVSGTINLQEAGVLGIAVINSGVKNIPFRDKDDNLGESFNFSDLSVGLSYGYGIEDVGAFSWLEGISFGAGFKILSNNFGYQNAERKTGFGGLDVGILKHGFSGKLSCGFVVRNIAGKIGEGTVPAIIDAGISYKLINKYYHATVALDVEKEFVDISENLLSLRLGVEYWLFNNTLAIRAGGQRTSDRSSLFAGFGVKVATLQLDYAFKPTDNTAHQLNGNSHYVSLSYGY